MGSAERKKLLGCLVLGGMLLAGLLALLHSCTVSRAQSDGPSPAAPGAAPASPAAPDGAGSSKADAMPAGKAEQTDTDSDDNAKADDDAEKASDADKGAAATPEAGSGKRGRHGAAAHVGPDAEPGGDDSAEPTAAAAPSAPAAKSAAGGRPSGFTELQKGWPASTNGTPDEGSTDAEQQSAPSMQLTDEGRDFAGRWVAAVINKDGQARLLSSEDEWAFNLGLDGRCSARQKLGTQYWEQSGWWQLQGDTLTLSLGPGGVWVFGLQRQDNDIAVWTRAAEDDKSPKFTLFCVRTPETKMPPGLAASYNSDFGPLRFQPSGPGHWRAAYGDPLGKLSLTRVGGFLAGRWEQQPGVGFVLFRPNAAGNSGAAASLDGVWWYAGSMNFDGQWRADRAK